ncbi:MAG: crossover junction endodeoxyribonuclease RuvC [Balneolales bacterium]|nr:crossover junction endodeoxyribonuclease RuvC [Balneolales bacterium]
MPEVILGIDPGSRITGYAVLTEEHGKLIALRCDVLKMAHIEEHSDRLQFIFENISGIIKSIKPTKCAVETPIYGVDPQAMLKLGRAQAAAILAIKNCGLEATEYFPKVVKKSITGNGNASKDQVAFMLKKMVTLPDEKLPSDATDALAVAWCHMMNNRGIPASTKKTHQNNKKGDWSAFVEQNPDRVKGV